MTKFLEKAIAEVLELPEDTQNMAADALFMVIEHVNEESHYRLNDEQIAGVAWWLLSDPPARPQRNHPLSV